MVYNESLTAYKIIHSRRLCFNFNCFSKQSGMASIIDSSDVTTICTSLDTGWIPPGQL